MGFCRSDKKNFSNITKSLLAPKTKKKILRWHSQKLLKLEKEGNRSGISLPFNLLNLTGKYLRKLNKLRFLQWCIRQTSFKFKVLMIKKYEHPKWFRLYRWLQGRGKWYYKSTIEIEHEKTLFIASLEIKKQNKCSRDHCADYAMFI